MLELLLLECYKNKINQESMEYNKQKYLIRLQELKEEFLRPYVIN